MLQLEVLYINKAIEFLKNGVDITKLSRDDYSKVPDASGKLIEAAGTTFNILYDDKSKDLLGIYNKIFSRQDRKYKIYSVEEFKKEGRTINAKIDYDTILQVIKALKEIGIATFNSVPEELLDPEFLKKIEATRKSFDYTKAFDCEIKNKLTIDATKDEVKTLLALSQYPTDLAPKMFDYFMTPKKEFVLRRFKDFEVVDNRIIIPLSPADKYDLKQKLYKATNGSYDLKLLEINAVVLSKNLLDYYFCSYGNEFQSCFSLTSIMSAWYGYMPNVITDESFIMYVTSGAVNKTSVISGTKFHNPQMFLRTWAYADNKGDLLIDKKYRGNGTGTTAMIEFICQWLEDKFGAHCDYKKRIKRNLYNNGRGIAELSTQYGLYFYSDSLIKDKDDKVSFKYGCGQSIDEIYKPIWKKENASFFEFTKQVTKVDNIDLTAPHIICNGVLQALKLCPVTGFPIDSDIDKHPLAKYFTKPSKKTAMLTYVGGSVFVDYLPDSANVDCKGFYLVSDRSTGRGFEGGVLYASNYFTGIKRAGAISLKTLKEHIKGNIKNTKLDAILLRIVEDDKVTIQIFKNVKG